MTPTAPHVRIRPVGNLGNQMLQRMLARTLEQRVPGLVVDGYDMPPWNLRAEAAATLPPRHLRLIGQYLDLPELARLLERRVLRSVEVASLGFDMAHYGPPSSYLDLFPYQPVEVPEGYAQALVINVRGAEILGDVHPDYGPIPIDFYRRLIAASGRHPVFMGQLGDDPYSSALRAAFPQASWLASRGVRGDFELMRSARHLVLSVSTFSWLAGWLGRAETVHMPLLGMFNPTQRPDIQLLPLGDARYRFHAFPVRAWNGSPAQFEALTAPVDARPLDAAGAGELVRQAGRRLAPARARYRRRLLLHAWIDRFVGSRARIGLALD